jgi:hypothetical protein
MAVFDQVLSSEDERRAQYRQPSKLVQSKGSAGSTS